MRPMGAFSIAGRLALVAAYAAIIPAMQRVAAAKPGEVIYRGYYNIKPMHSAKCIDVVDGSTSNGARIQQWDCSGVFQQDWQFRRQGFTNEGHPIFTIRSRKSDQCLDVVNGGGHNGAEVQQFPCNDYPQQSWIQAEALPGWFRYHPSHTGTGMCLDVRNASRDNGARLQIWSCDLQPNGNAHQIFGNFWH